MDIRKPKPWHGVREFLKEYLIIVIGVLTALVAEQAVDLLHQRHLAEQAREAIRKEAESNLAWMAFRLRSDNCVTARIAEVQNIVLQWSAKKTLPAPLWIGRPITAVIRSAALDSASSTGRTALLSADEQARFATLRYYFQSLEENQVRERTVWARLQVLEGGPPYSAALQTELLLALQEAKSYRARGTAAARQALRDSRPLKLEPDPNFTSGGITPPACIPLGTRREEALNTFYGNSDRTSEP